MRTPEEIVAKIDEIVFEAKKQFDVNKFEILMAEIMTTTLNKLKAYILGEEE